MELVSSGDEVTTNQHELLVTKAGEVVASLYDILRLAEERKEDLEKFVDKELAPTLGKRTLLSHLFTFLCR
jgi:hypothetical protein